MKYKHTNPDNVLMVRKDLKNFSQYEFENGYYTRFYQPGDMLKWIEIQSLSNPDSTFSKEKFEATYDYKTELLNNRMLFLCNSKGLEIGTATAWFENDDVGLLHWLAIVPAFQGRGLSKPLMTSVFNLLVKFGYKSCILRTKLSRIIAIKLYIKFGFKPYIETDQDRKKWQLVKSYCEQEGIDFLL